MAAIHLAHKLTRNPDHSVKLLVADRTFWNLDKVAAGFLKQNSLLINILRKMAGPITRLLFSQDCIDNSVTYLECRCKKICIWDRYD